MQTPDVSEATDKPTGLASPVMVDWHEPVMRELAKGKIKNTREWECPKCSFFIILMHGVAIIQ